MIGKLLGIACQFGVPIPRISMDPVKVAEHNLHVDNALDCLEFMKVRVYSKLEEGMA
jgi:hypothetical protein